MFKKLVLLLLCLSTMANIFFTYRYLKNDNVIEYAISNHHGDPAEDLIEIINHTKNQLDIAIYNLDHPEIASAIIEAKRRNVQIRLIVDKEKAQNKDSAELLAKLYAAKIPIKINAKKKMHLKLTISDAQQIAVGSFNYTKESANENVEALISIQNKDLSEQWSQLFNQLWNDESYTTWQPDDANGKQD